jgi:3-hydroxyacyl-CoA dehydrogenase
MRMRYSPKPIVVAPAGLALGGGCEITMHAPRVVAAAETYIGLVELGAGVIPAGGGTKEMLRRIVNPVMRVENAEVLAPLQRAFLQMGQAKVATSAEEARGMNILGPADRIVMNRDHLLTEAKKEVLHMIAAGYKPPAPEPSMPRDGMRWLPSASARGCSPKANTSRNTIITSRANSPT